MVETLAQLRQKAKEAIAAAAVPDALEALRVHFLGKKGELTDLLKQVSALSKEERPAMGQALNALRGELESLMSERRKALESETMTRKLSEETLDVTWPGASTPVGHAHPMASVLREVEEIFIGMGFSIAEGPELETTWHCFTALNTDENHPARDRQDTFYVSDDVILRTQTSSVQIRYMLENKPPIRIVSPGRVFRKDEVDATHSPMFHQIEGLVVDRGITMAHLKGTLEMLMKALYGEQTRTRFRPHHFPYTEPSAEVDISCYVCGGEGCRVCKQEGWIELLGCGMVHPKVLSLCGIDPEVYSGFAFGIGLERITLGRYNIDDMRLLFENDLRFLSQF